MGDKLERVDRGRIGVEVVLVPEVGEGEALEAGVETLVEGKTSRWCYHDAGADVALLMSKTPYA